MAETPASRPRFHNLLQLIAGLTLIIGLAAAIPVGFFYSWLWAVGVAIGAFLSWLNLRWLKQGVAALAAASVAQAAGASPNQFKGEGAASAMPESPQSSRALTPQAGTTPDSPGGEIVSARGKAHVPLTSYFFAMFRYALIALAVYVIFKYLKVPVLSMIAGLFALGAATLVASLYEILRSVD